VKAGRTPVRRHGQSEPALLTKERRSEDIPSCLSKQANFNVNCYKLRKDSQVCIARESVSLLLTTSNCLSENSVCSQILMIRKSFEPNYEKLFVVGIVAVVVK
jgi:hypothetical protein